MYGLYFLGKRYCMLSREKSSNMDFQKIRRRFKITFLGNQGLKIFAIMFSWFSVVGRPKNGLRQFAFLCGLVTGLRKAMNAAVEESLNSLYALVNSKIVHIASAQRIKCPQTRAQCVNWSPCSQHFVQRWCFECSIMLRSLEQVCLSTWKFQVLINANSNSDALQVSIILQIFVVPNNIFRLVGMMCGCS